MLSLVLLLLLAVAVLGKIVKEDYSFEQYIADFKHKWQKGSAEYENRKSLFEAEHARVLNHNKRGLSWTEGLNKFSAMTATEKKAFRGYSKNAASQHKPSNFKKELPADFKLEPIESLPTSVDWRSKGVVTAVKDQGMCGSCWAFASTAVMESHVALSTGLLFDLSPEQMAMCAPNPNSCGGTGGCQGSTAELAYEYAASTGFLQEFQYPYTSYYGQNFACNVPASSPVAGIEGYVQLPSNNYTSLMNAVAKIGPIAVTVCANTWGAYESGIFSGCSSAPMDLDHAVILMGYGEENGVKYWTVRNSWSPTWGEKGYIRITRTDKDESVCAMDDTPQDGTACKGETDPVKACGQCGILYDSAFPTGAKLL